MSKVRQIFVPLAFLTVLSAFLQASPTCLAADKSHNVLEQSLVIKAPAKVVFEGIQMSRSADPDRRHIVSHQQDVTVIDEKISDLPMIGTAHLVYKEIEVPFKRIDYLLVSSDKFKAFEGSWELTPLENGQGTRVCLKSHSEIKMWAPFARELSSSQTIKDINRRLNNLKQWCDDQQITEATVHQANENGHSLGRPHSQSHLAENKVHAKVHADDTEAGHEQPARDELH